jgi:hypothetical protein
MVALGTSIAWDSSYAPAVFGLVGSLIGGFIAGGISLLVAWQARKAAEGAWVRDNRRVIYDRFLTYAQKLLIACETRKDAHRNQEAVEASVESAYTKFFEVYGVVQTVAGIGLVNAARVYAYRLSTLKENLVPGLFTNVMEPENFGPITLVGQLIRDARHDTIDAMRAELRLGGSISLEKDYNPFAGTDLEPNYAQAKQDLKEKHAQAEQDRPGPTAAA